MGYSPQVIIFQNGVALPYFNQYRTADKNFINEIINTKGIVKPTVKEDAKVPEVPIITSIPQPNLEPKLFPEDTPFKLSNVSKFQTKDSVTITWNTDKPTDASIIGCQNALGGVCIGANDSEYSTYHSLTIPFQNGVITDHITIKGSLPNSPSTPIIYEAGINKIPPNPEMTSRIVTNAMGTFETGILGAIPSTPEEIALAKANKGQPIIASTPSMPSKPPEIESEKPPKVIVPPTPPYAMFSQPDIPYWEDKKIAASKPLINVQIKSLADYVDKKGWVNNIEDLSSKAMKNQALGSVALSNLYPELTPDTKMETTVLSGIQPTGKLNPKSIEGIKDLASNGYTIYTNPTLNNNV